MSKKTPFRGSFGKQHGKWGETLFKTEQQHLYWKQFRLEKSLWVICYILGPFFSQCTADNKYSLLNRESSLLLFLVISIIFLIFSNAIIPETKNIFSLLFVCPKFRFNLEHLQKKDDPHSWYIFELTDPEKRG